MMALLKRPHVIAFLLLFVLAFPQCAQANAGTPLMWAGALHLFFGNALIGIFEGLLIGWLFSTSKWESVWLMILANYLSAWLGVFLIDGFVKHILHPDLNNGWRCLWIMVAATYIFTLIIEWPFVALCFWRANKWLKKSVLASLVVQTASYVLIFGWYSMVSGTSLYTEMNIVEPGEMSLPESVMVYYISPEDGDVYERKLAGGNARKVYELNSTNAYDQLFFRPNASDATHWDLVSKLAPTSGDEPEYVDVLTNLDIEASQPPASDKKPQYDGRHPFRGEAYTLAIPNDKWQFKTGFWPGERLLAENKETGERIWFYCSTPFVSLWFHNAVHLPNDILLFQIDDDQICAFAPSARKVSLLWRGRCPAPFCPRNIAKQTKQ